METVVVAIDTASSNIFWGLIMVALSILLSARTNQ